MKNMVWDPRRLLPFFRVSLKAFRDPPNRRVFFLLLSRARNGAIYLADFPFIFSKHKMQIMGEHEMCVDLYTAAKDGPERKKRKNALKGAVMEKRHREK